MLATPGNGKTENSERSKCNSFGQKAVCTSINFLGNFAFLETVQQNAISKDASPIASTSPFGNLCIFLQYGAD